MRELNEIHDFDTYVQVKAGNLSREEKKKAPESLIFVTDKRNGDIKAYKVTDRSMQHVQWL